MVTILVAVVVACVCGEYLRPVEKLVDWLAHKRDSGKI